MVHFAHDYQERKIAIVPAITAKRWYSLVIVRCAAVLTGLMLLVGLGYLRYNAYAVAHFHREEVIVKPGDTLWSIATEIDPHQDPRMVVYYLEKLIGRNTIYPGEKIFIN